MKDKDVVDFCGNELVKSEYEALDSIAERHFDYHSAEETFESSSEPSKGKYVEIKDNGKILFHAKH